MAHEIHDTDHMISVGETPWHGLGTILPTAPETTAEALQLSRLDWTVRTEQAFHTIEIPTDDGVIERREPIPAQVVIRDDTNAVLGVVGPRWRPVQNVDAFKWFDRWVDTKRVRIETAGSLFGSRKVWILARIVSDPIVVGCEDEIRKYVLLAHSHDGTLAIRVGSTLVRVVCNNTLSAAVATGDATGGLYKVSHTSGALERLEDLADEIELIDARLSSSGESFRELAKHAVTGGEKTVIEYVGHVYGQTEEQVKSGRRLSLIQELFARGRGQDLQGSRGTWWGLYNAITEAETHGNPDAKSSDERRENRASRNVWGTGAKTLQRALDVALAKVRGMLLPMPAASVDDDDEAAG